MSKLQIGLLIWSVLTIIFVLFIHGASADARVRDRMKDIEQQKKRIRWPVSR